MEMRPITPELLLKCSQEEYCTNCDFRIGCSMRKSFYSDEEIFEINLQLAELMLQKQFPKDKECIFVSTQDVRKKRKHEIKEKGPYFSYT